MSIMEKISAHHAAKQRKEHYIEAWDVTVYSNPITIKLFDVIDKLRQTHGTAESLARTIVLLAEDADGKKMFSKADIPKLVRIGDLKIIAEAVTALTTDAEVDVEELEQD